MATSNTSRKKSVIIVILSMVISVSILVTLTSINFQTSEPLVEPPSIMDNYIENLSKSHIYKVEKGVYFELYFNESDYNRHLQGLKHLEGARLSLNPTNAAQLIDDLKPNSDTVVIFPTFTAAAYYPNAFYNYYSGSCDESCITNVSFENFYFDYNESGITAQILYHLGYDFITDMEVDMNPELLEHYDTVILLHNEYVTKKEFDAISNHPNLIFLHPNALYAEIKVDYDTNTMTLIRGHNYPDNSISNGFDYKIEQKFHKYEKDSECKDWKFVEIENGFHLNCYPENIIHKNLNILLNMKEL